MVEAVLTSSVDIVNMALGAHLGKPTIVSYDADTQDAAKCRLWYPVSVRFVAHLSDWSFLREIASLAVLTNDRSDFYDYRYAYPSRALKLFSLLDPMDDVTPYDNYEIVGGNIYTPLYQARAKYSTLENTAEEDWPLFFKIAVAAKLAELLAPSMTRRSTDIERFRIMAAQAASQGIEEDASQENTTYARDYSYANEDATTSTYERQTDGSTIWSS